MKCTGPFKHITAHSQTLDLQQPPLCILHKKHSCWIMLIKNTQKFIKTLRVTNLDDERFVQEAHKTTVICLDLHITDYDISITKITIAIINKQYNEQQ